MTIFQAKLSDWWLSYLSMGLSDETSILVQIMVWCRQATRHHLSQYWSRSIYPCSTTRPQWVNRSRKDYELFPANQIGISLQWRHNGRDSVSNRQPNNCLLYRLFRRRSKKTSKLRATGLCAGNSPGTCEFPAQMASNAENVSIWWRHHDTANIRAPRLVKPSVAMILSIRNKDAMVNLSKLWRFIVEEWYEMKSYSYISTDSLSDLRYMYSQTKGAYGQRNSL